MDEATLGVVKLLFIHVSLSSLLPHVRVLECRNSGLGVGVVMNTSVPYGFKQEMCSQKGAASVLFLSA